MDTQGSTKLVFGNDLVNEKGTFYHILKVKVHTPPNYLVTTKRSYMWKRNAQCVLHTHAIDIQYLRHHALALCGDLYAAQIQSSAED